MNAHEDSTKGTAVKLVHVRTKVVPALAVLVAALAVAVGTRAQAPAGRYTVSGGVVTDTQTGLAWEKANDGNSYTLATATQHCASLGTGWRVPSMKELQTLVDESVQNPAIDPVFVVNSTATTLCFHSSSSSGKMPSLHFETCFDTGRGTWAVAGETDLVRCVH